MSRNRNIQMTPDILARVLVHMDMAGTRRVFLFSSVHRVLDDAPDVWNSFCRSSGLTRTQCRQLLKNRGLLVRSIRNMLEKQTTFGTGQSDMTHLAVNNNIIYVSSDDQSIKAFDLRGNVIRRFLGHTGGVWTFETSGQRLVTGSTDRTARIWDMSLEHSIRVLRCHRSTVRVLKCHGDYIVTGSRDHTIGVWNSIGDLLHRLEGHEQSVRCMDMSDDYLVSGSYDGTCKLWDYKRGKFIKNIHIHDKRVYCVRIQNDYVASGGLDSDVKISKIDGSADMTYRHSGSTVGWLDFQNGFIVSSSLDGTVVKYDCMHQKIDFVIHENLPVKAQKVTDSLIIVATSKEVKVYLFSSGRHIRTLMSAYMITKVEMDGWKIIVGYILNGEYKISVFDYETCRIPEQH